jgi:hypothetical protein
MRHTSLPGLTLEDAMSVHVLRADGMIFSELTRRFGANPARFHEILCGKLYPESWGLAVRRLEMNDPWHAEIAQLLESRGAGVVLAALNAVNPSKRRYQNELKRLRKSAPPTAYVTVSRGLDRGVSRRTG